LAEQQLTGSAGAIGSNLVPRGRLGGAPILQGTIKDMCRTSPDQRRRGVAASIATIGNLENEQTSVEHGYRYAHSAITLDDGSGAATEGTHYYVPSVTPGTQLPSAVLSDGSAL
jgi:hypothetical protein